LRANYEYMSSAFVSITVMAGPLGAYAVAEPDKKRRRGQLAKTLNVN
jgi:hypothetical protein